MWQIERALLGVGDRLDAARAGVHVLLRRGRSLAGRRIAIRRLPRRLESVFGRGQMVAGAAMLGGSVLGGVIAQATPSACRSSSGSASCWRCSSSPGASCATSASRPSPAPSAPRHARGAVGLGRLRDEEPPGLVRDARRPVRHGRRHLRLLCAAALSSWSSTATRRPIPSPVWRRRSSPGADRRRLCGAEDPPPVQEADRRA